MIYMNEQTATVVVKFSTHPAPTDVERILDAYFASDAIATSLGSEEICTESFMSRDIKCSNLLIK